jgi:hypothetical protein
MLSHMRVPLSLALALCAFSTSVSAEPGERAHAARDRFDLDVRSDTFLELYRRALLPGAGGALVSTETLAPLHEYVAFNAHGLDLPGARDSVDVELSAWGRTELVSVDEHHRTEGELQSASVRYHRRGLFVQLGRQAVAGGAARYLRFDGVSAGQSWESGLSIAVYAGFSVRPPAFLRRGYRLLGAAPDTLLRNPEALEGTNPSGDWVLGARARYERSERWGISASFHEQREAGELARRNLAADAHLELAPSASASAAVLFDIDSASVADARAFVDYSPLSKLDLGAEYLHTQPALFLSRQSVLSVFSTAEFDELGASLRFRPVRDAEFGGAAFLDYYSSSDVGGRAELRARLRPEGSERLLVLLTLSRVQAAETGYRSARLAVRRRLVTRLTGTAEAYLYLYDAPVRGYSASAVYAATLEWKLLDRWGILWGGSLARSPYAALDAQTILRVSYALPGSRSSR